jgi:hypothetical protein
MCRLVALEKSASRRSAQSHPPIEHLYGIRVSRKEARVGEILDRQRGRSQVESFKEFPMGQAKGNAQRKRKASSGISYADVCAIALELPEVEEGTSYGTPALKVRGKLLARLKEDGETLVLRTTLADRAQLLSAAPDLFYLTDHYIKHSWILVRLTHIDRPFLRELLGEAWRLSAPATLVKAPKTLPKDALQ